MNATRRFLAVTSALALTTTLGLGAARASSIRDEARMFSPEAVRQAESRLDRIEREYGVPVTVETVPSLEGQAVDVATRRLASQARTLGLFIVIAKNDNKLDVISERSYSRALNRDRCRAIQNAFLAGFKAHDFDAGLLAGVKAAETEVAAAKAQFGNLRQSGGVGRPAGVPGRRGNPQGGFGLGSLLMIGLLIVGGLFIVRTLGRLFGGGGYARPMGGGMGPGGYGYGGGGGGGFMSGLFGGLGGALAGNWLYDQFSGRHHGGGYGDNMGSGDVGPTDAGPDWSGGADAGGASWGDGGGDAGGGDWGGGGGGGDWGGGGGGDGGSW